MKYTIHYKTIDINVFSEPEDRVDADLIECDNMGAYESNGILFADMICFYNYPDKIVALYNVNSIIKIEVEN